MANPVPAIVHDIVTPIGHGGSEFSLGDLRFRALLGAEAWATLPHAVRARFSKRLTNGATAIYSGRVIAVCMSKSGRLLAQALRVIGAPLPIFDDADVPTVVSVTEDTITGGQIWSRLYCHRKSFPQVIHSVKCFSGPTGLEEYVGFGVSVTLKVSVENEALCFRSAGYVLGRGRFRFRLPHMFAPGELLVTHREITPEQFEFTMTLTHPLLGELVYQAARYREERHDA